MNYAVIRPVVEAMRPDPRVTFYFTASEIPARAREVYSEAPKDLRVISPRRAAFMKFDAYIAADILWVTLPRGTKRIQMFHGVAGKYSNIYDSPERSMRHWDRLFFINRLRLRNFVTSGAIDAESPNARLVGFPKLDCLVDGSLSRDALLSEMGIDPARRTVLYAPTWSAHSSLNTAGEKLVRRLCDAGYAVIVKLHDRSRDAAYHHSGGIDWPSRLGAILKKYGGLLAAGSDSCPYLAASDVLITDHSSVGFEYLLLDRPVVRIETPELIEATNINRQYVSLLAEASITARTARGAVAAVNRCIVEPSLQSVARRSVASKLFFNPGTATARAVREIYEVLELDTAPESGVR
jgi:hypothetical protein